MARLSPAFLSSVYPGYMHAQALQSQIDEQRARALLDQAQARYAQPVSTGGVDLSQFFTDPGAATMVAQPGGLPQQVPGAGPPGGPPAPAPSTGFAGGAGAPSQGPGLPPQVAASPPPAPLPGAGAMGGPLAGGAGRPPVMLAQTGGGMPQAAPPPGMGVPPQVAPSPMGAPPPAPGMGQPGMGQGQPRQFNAAAAFQALRRNPANAGVPEEALLQYVRQFQQTMTAGQPTPYQQEEFVQRQQEFKEREADRSLDRARLEKSDKEREADRAAAAADRRDAASARNQVAQPGMGTDPKTGEQVFGMHFFDKVKQTDTFVPTSGAVGAGAVSTALREKMNQGKMPDEDTIKGMVGQVKSGQPETEVVPGFSGSGVVGQLRQRIKTDAVKGIMEDHPGMTAEQAGVYLANQRNAYLGSRSSDRQLMTQRGAIYAATQQLDYQLTNAEKVMNQIGGNSTPVLNAIVRGEERWTGDPKYSELFLYMTAATTEAARIMSGGTASAAQLHEGAREEAKHWLDANWTTPQQFASIKKALQGEASNRIENFTGALNYQKMTGTSAGGGPPAASGANDPLGIR